MFDQFSRQKKQRNWKTFNLNLNDAQQQPQYNRSIIADTNKKYCPRKDSSHQKLFSKSKQRLNQSKSQHSNNQGFHFKGVNKQANGKPNPSLNSETSFGPNTVHTGIEGKRNNKYQQLPPSHQKTSIRNSFDVHEDYQTGQNNNPNRRNTMAPATNFNFEQILNPTNLNTKPAHNYKQLRNQIKQNTSIVSDIKFQFETFKSIVIRQLQGEKQFLRQCVLRLTDELTFVREKIREEVYAEFQIKHKSLSASFKQSRKNSTEIRLQDMFKMKDHSLEQIEAFQSSNILNLDTFGKIQPNFSQLKSGSKIGEKPLRKSEIKNHNNSQIVEDISFVSSEKQFEKSLHESRHQESQMREQIDGKVSSIRIKQKNNNFGTKTQISDAIQNKQVSTRELRTYKSSENFVKAPNVQNKNNQPPIIFQPHIANQYMSQMHSVISSKKHIDETDHMKRFSQILKRQYEQKAKSSVNISKLDRDKINERMSHVSKFQGAMQKLKSQIMEFKNLSDTKDIKKIKFSEQKPSQKFLQQIKLNEINYENKPVNYEASKGF